MFDRCLSVLACILTFGLVLSVVVGIKYLPHKAVNISNETVEHNTTFQTTVLTTTETTVTEIVTEIVTTTPPITSTKPINDNELYIMAHLIHGEAGNLSYKARLYTGSVMLNRVISQSYPNSIEDVVFQSGQYACTWDGNYNKEPDDIDWEIAEYLLKYGSVIPKNVVYQAQFIQGSGVYAKLEGEYFCYE